MRLGGGFYPSSTRIGLTRDGLKNYVRSSYNARYFSRTHTNIMNKMTSRATQVTKEETNNITFLPSEEKKNERIKNCDLEGKCIYEIGNNWNRSRSLSDDLLQLNLLAVAVGYHFGGFWFDISDWKWCLFLNPAVVVTWVVYHLINSTTDIVRER